MYIKEERILAETQRRSEEEFTQRSKDPGKRNSRRDAKAQSG